MALTRRVIECLLRLNSPEFSAFREWLEELRQEARDKCETLEGVAQARSQGKAGALRELNDYIGRARDLVDKVK